LFEDEMFRSNIEGALAAGLQVGVYFFSQAVNAEEAREEAGFILELIKDYDVTFPVAFDWERIEGETESRTYDLPGETLTDCALAFCETVKDAGYEPAVYFYRDLGYNEYDLNRLKGLKFWVGAVGGYPDFYYEHQIWQYSFTGTVDGIGGGVDLNMCFTELPDEEGALAEEADSQA
jgi:lysozyme